jgi:NTE family protein
MRIRVNRSCSTATAESTWRTPSPPAARSGLPYRIGDSRYIDGGFRRNENADLAAGCGRVLVLSPFGGRTLQPLDWGMQLAAQVDELRARGSRVETIFPDSNSEHMFGADAMDLSLRPPAARAGYDQGRALAEQLTGFWC